MNQKGVETKLRAFFVKPHLSGKDIVRRLQNTASCINTAFFTQRCFGIGRFIDSLGHDAGSVAVLKIMIIQYQLDMANRKQYNINERSFY